MKRHVAFDALRGIAAIDVMLFHVTNVEKRPVLLGGYLAVDLFFLLSGFVLWNAYGPRLALGEPVRRFGKARVLRLYPLFAIGLMLGIVRAIGGMRLGDGRAPTMVVLMVEIVTGALLIPTDVDPRSVFPLDNPAWSLSLEVIVNIVFCFCLVHLSRRNLARLGAVAALGVVATAVYFGSLDTGWRASDYVGGPARCLFSFTIGILIARMPITLSIPARIAPFVPAGLVLLLTGALAFDAGVTARPVFDLFCVFLVFPAIVAIASRLTMRGWSARLSTAIGEMSYPLYATHYPLILPLGILCARLHIGGSSRIVVVALVCVMFAGVLVPVDRTIRSRFASRPGTATVPDATGHSLRRLRLFA